MMAVVFQVAPANVESGLPSCGLQLTQFGPLQDPGNLHRAKVAKLGLEAHIPLLELLVRRTEYGKACETRDPH